jgi:hypothetical protein
LSEVWSVASVRTFTPPLFPHFHLLTTHLPAVIAFLILGLFYISRRTRKPAEQTPAQAQAATYHSPAQSPPPMGYGPPSDYRGSMFKPPETSPVGSPPTSPGAVHAFDNPQPTHAVVQPPTYPEHRYELPIDRGDGEVRELRG